MSEPDEAGNRSARDSLHPPHRLLMLADGVFAISMTLLALDVRIPDSVADNATAYGNAQWDLYGRLGVFIAAFIITSRFWVLNHQQMRALHHADTGVIERMILFLAGICSIPVATSVLFRPIGSQPGSGAVPELGPPFQHAKACTEPQIQPQAGTSACWNGGA